MKRIAFVCLLLLSGCVSVIEPRVECTKQWEGHYMTTNDFYNATRNIELKDGESVWVLSSSTLIRVLENTRVK